MAASSTAFVNVVSAHTWHARLGHLSLKRLEALQTRFFYDASSLHKASPYYVFPLAKQRWLSFVSNNHMSQPPFELICGPHHVPSYNDYRYFLILVDDYFRFT